MLQLQVKVKDRQNMFGSGFAKRLKYFEDAELRARKMAARAATTATRANFSYLRDPIAPRPGRSSTGGRMKQSLEWSARNGRVEFDMTQADREAPHWIIQEIGTGSRATLRSGGADNPVGRPRKGATYVRTVKSQKGRRIKGGLVFATGGVYSPPGARRDEQLQFISRVTGAPHRPAAIRISREIHGQHFVRKGGQAGFHEYSQSVLAAARQAFQKSARL